MTRVAIERACLICDAPSAEAIYRHRGGVSVSSTARTLDVPTVVYACARCGHVQSEPLDNVEEYYDRTYNVHLESDDADDLYELRDGRPVFRTQHQAAVALEKLKLPHGASVLDFGCGKGSALRAILGHRPDLAAAVFDVSENYRAHWDEFVPRERQATYEPPLGWRDRFDVVFSFFALEHVARPQVFLETVRGLVRPGGTLHVVVPNIRQNVGDLIVVDHVNHFMPTSLRYAFARAGFGDVRIDEHAHAAAYVIDARRVDAEPFLPHAAEVDAYLAEARDFAAFWAEADTTIARFEASVRGRPAAIYGSGLYGVFIASRLADRSPVRYFLDQNPHQQAKTIFGLPVRPPNALEDEVEVVYAALNPARARAIIAGVPAIARRPRAVLYL